MLLQFGEFKMIKQLNPKNFANYSQNEKDIAKKIFLYSDRDVSEEEIAYGEKEYGLEDPMDIDLPGQLTDVLHSIGRTLFNSYEWSILSASFCDGFLICYLDFVTGDDSEAKQLNFRVYKLKEIKFRKR